MPYRINSQYITTHFTLPPSPFLPLPSLPPFPLPPSSGKYKPEAFMPYRINGQYIIEGLAASFMFVVGGAPLTRNHVIT